MTSLSPSIQSVLDLFKGPLSGVRFADIDAEGLAALAEEVEAAASEVQQQKEQLATLEQNLAQRQEALLVLAQRALAYARVYAENDEPLLEELNRISLPRAAKPRKPGAAKASPASHAAAETVELDAGAASTEALSTNVPSTDVLDAAPQRAVRKGRKPASQPSAG